MKIFATPAMKDSFSRAVTALVSFHLSPNLSMLSLMRLPYFSSFSSAVAGTRRFHSSAIRRLASLPRVTRASRCFLTLLVCFETAFESFSSRSGTPKLSKRSKTVRRSRGGKASQSSWKEPLLVNELFRDKFGLLVESKIGLLGTLPVSEYDVVE